MSSRNMTLTEFKHTSKKIDDTHTVKVSGFSKDSKPPKYFTVFANKMLAFVEKQEQFNYMFLMFLKETALNKYKTIV